MLCLQHYLLAACHIIPSVKNRKTVVTTENHVTNPVTDADKEWALLLYDRTLLCFKS